MFIEPTELSNLLKEEDAYIAFLKEKWQQQSLPSDTEHKLRIGKRVELLGNLQARKIDDKPAQQNALGIAAQCWCDPNCSRKTMDTDLAASFASRYEKLLQRIQELEEKNQKLRQACKNAYNFVDDVGTMLFSALKDDNLDAKANNISDCSIMEGGRQ